MVGRLIGDGEVLHAPIAFVDEEAFDEVFGAHGQSFRDTKTGTLGGCRSAEAGREVRLREGLRREPDEERSWLECRKALRCGSGRPEY